ncbi:MAG: hypothetical protein WCP53_06600 [Verrucomicrobiota bacterium]
MPGTILTSDDIASRFGGFSVNTMAADPFAEHLGGRALSMGASAGGALLTGGMALAGIDPLSIGLRSGMGALAGGSSLTGAAAMGMGAAGAVALPLMAGGYAVNQMFHGAQQQQQLNNTLRSNFRQLGGGGQGFGRGEMGAIGSGLREMTHQMGPGGEVASYGELTSMVGQMSQLGLTKGVKDVQEFSKRFKEMVDAAKVMARELGTTLQGATEAMGSMRQMGVFGTGSQMQFATQARSYAMSGGLAMSEVTAMGSIGSQVSRSVGGRGRQGAMGGMRAIGTVGAALQSGVLTDENIFDSTGLTGAEGRQAMATNMMSRDANFLRSTRGRYFMAQMADRDGNLDAGVAQEFMNGGMSVERTKELAHGALGKVGKANFLRNEGRLRGSVLEQFGGNVNVMALQGWASSRGIDINDMDDRSMILGQRQTGMGRDEFESALKMAKGLPEIMRQQQNSATSDQMLRTRADKLSTRGIAGLQKNFERFKHEINSSFEQAGADIESYVSNQIERFINEQSGIHAQRIHSQLGSAINDMQSGRGSSQLRSLTGIGRGGASGGAIGTGSAGAADFLGKNIGWMGSVHGSRADQLDAAGFHIDRGADTDQKMAAELHKVRMIQSATIGGPRDDAMRKMSSQERDAIQTYAAFSDKKGTDYIRGISKYLVGQGLTGTDSLANRFASGKQDDVTLAGRARELSAGADARGLVERMDHGVNMGLDGSSGPATDMDLKAQTFRRATGRDSRENVTTGITRVLADTAGTSAKYAAAGAVLGLPFGLVGSFITGSAGATAGAIKGFAASMWNGKATDAASAHDKEISGIVNGEKYQDTMRRLQSEDPKEVEAARQEVLKDLQKNGGGSAADKEAYGSMLAAADYMKLSKDGTEQISEEAAATLAKKYNLPGEGNWKGKLAEMAQGQQQVVRERQEEQARVVVQQIKEASSDTYARISASGMIRETDGKIELTDQARKIAGGDDSVMLYMQRSADIAKQGSSMEMGQLGRHFSRQDAQGQLMGEMSVDQLRKIADLERQSGNLQGAGAADRRAGTLSKFERSQRRGGLVGTGNTLVSELGISMDQKTKSAYSKALAGGDTNAAAGMLASAAGLDATAEIEVDGTKQSLRTAMDTYKGSAAGMAKVAAGISGSSKFQEGRARKSEEEEKAKNPLLAQMVELAKKQEATLTKIATNTGNMAAPVPSGAPKPAGRTETTY